MIATITMAQLAAVEDGGFWLTCAAPGCPERQRLVGRQGVYMTAAEAAARWGGEMSGEAIRGRARCALCGHRGANIRIEILGDWPVNGKSPRRRSTLA